MNVETYLQHQVNRRDSYKLAAACFRLPEEDAFEKMAELKETLGKQYPEAAEHVTGTDRECDVEQLRIDYSRLFVGPFELLAPPYGSVYLEGARKIMGDSTIDARNRYEAAGLSMSGEFKEAPDHIVIELEFMYYLIFKEIESIEKSDLEGAVDYATKQVEFLGHHLGAWIPAFATAVEKYAQTDHYGGLAQATRAYVQNDLRSIASVSNAPRSALATAG